MRGCSRVMIQSYIDEYLWRFNNKCTTDRKLAYNLIMNELARFYKPGTKLSEFDEFFDTNKDDIDNDDAEFEIESDCSSDGSSDQDCGSVLGSLDGEQD